MSLHDQLGFAPPLVPMKIGYELREKLSASLVGPVPEVLEPLIEPIAGRGEPRDVPTLDDDARRVEERPVIRAGAGSSRRSFSR